jgi:hypothetical protein
MKIEIKNSKVLLNLKEVFTIVGFTVLDDTLALLNNLDPNFVPGPLFINIFLRNTLVPVYYQSDTSNSNILVINGDLAV